jgi:hypothetical protein
MTKLVKIADTQTKSLDALVKEWTAHGMMMLILKLMTLLETKTENLNAKLEYLFIA